MRKYKAALVLMALVLLASIGAKQYSTITMGDNEWIGLASDAGRIVFDDQATDEVIVYDADFGVGTTNPGYEVDVLNTTGSAYMRVRSTGADAGLIMDASPGDARLYWKETGTTKWGLIYDTSEENMRLYNYVAPNTTAYFHNDGNINLVPNIGKVAIGSSSEPAYDLDVAGDARATGAVLADGRVQAGDAASDVDARTDMPFVAAGDGQGGYFFYNANVSADTDLTGLYSTEANVERQVRVEWLVYDVTAATRHSGETVLGYTGGIESVVIADEGANDLLFKVARGAPPNLVGYLCLDVVGNHSYEVVLMTMWH